MITRGQAAAELLRRDKAAKSFGGYIQYVFPDFHFSVFSRRACNALGRFIRDVHAGKRPILIFQAPPQHGKSELVSRRLPAYLLGKYPNLRVGLASYAADLAESMALDVRRNMRSEEHLCVFPIPVAHKNKYKVDRVGEFSADGGTGSMLAVGVGGGLSGRPLDIGIIDDPVKNEKEALSPTTKEAHWNWYQSVFQARLSKKSGQIIMATSWATDDLIGRLLQEFRGDSRLTILRFPAINDPDEPGYDPDMPLGALVPELHPIEQLREIKGVTSRYWWSALYQQRPIPAGGTIFLQDGIRYYLPKELPPKFDKIIASWDCAFKDLTTSDYVVGQVWGKKGANAYLLDQVRGRLSFTNTVKAVQALKAKWPRCYEVLVEDKANGPAIIDTLSKTIPGIIPIEPDGSKTARAHAVTSFFEAGNIWFPDPTLFDWVKALVDEILAFPVGANDDQVDALTQALRRLYPTYGSLNINRAILGKIVGRNR